MKSALVNVAHKGCAGQVLPGEVPARQVDAGQADAWEVLGLITGGAVELRGREGGGFKVGPSYVGARKVGVSRDYS